MNKTKENLEHRIQLKKDEIKRYLVVCENYPPDRMERHGKPFIQKLQNELTILENELEDRESKREVKRNLGFSRIGLNNV